MKLTVIEQVRVQDFKLGVGALKKIKPRGGRHKLFSGISCEKSRFYAKKILFFPILRGACAGCAPPGFAPVEYIIFVRDLLMNGGNSFHGIKKQVKTYHIVGIIPKSNIKAVERGKIDTPNTQTHDRSLSWVNIHTSLKMMRLD